MNQYPNHNYILKMDCEGEEYSIIEELNAAGILGRFKVIMLEWHYEGFKKITDFIDGLGYSYFFFEKENGMGLIYAQKVAG